MVGIIEFVGGKIYRTVNMFMLLNVEFETDPEEVM